MTSWTSVLCKSSLLCVQEVFDEWLLLQRVWLYLEPLFSSEDIAEHLPHETRRFAAVDALWRKTMAGALATYCSPLTTHYSLLTTHY